MIEELKMKTTQGGVTAAEGFSAAGVHAGIKGAKPDLALLVSDRPASIAGMFTTNAVQAAPVRLCRNIVERGTGRAVVINSGNANACTGAAGAADAERMASVTAAELGVDEGSVLVCSTGTIGVPLPMDKIEAGIRVAAAALSPDGGDAVARAIMTTDTVDKQAAVEIDIEGTRIVVGGMAKGAGMIDPHLATMLGFLATDASVRPESLQACLRDAVMGSFNRITIDGDQSTNDTVLFLANGAAGGATLDEKHEGWPEFCSAVKEVAGCLAMKVVEDGEGATKFVTVTVSGAASEDDARTAARAVANSLLVKTSWCGGDPNWGRVMAAVGYSGAEVREELVNISYDGIHAVRNGCAAPGVSLEDIAGVVARKTFSVEIALNLGDGSHSVHACDCSEEYVKINSEYMT